MGVAGRGGKVDALVRAQAAKHGVNAHAEAAAHRAVRRNRNQRGDRDGTAALGGSGGAERCTGLERLPAGEELVEFIVGRGGRVAGASCFSGAKRSCDICRSSTVGHRGGRKETSGSTNRTEHQFQNLVVNHYDPLTLCHPGSAASYVPLKAPEPELLVPANNLPDHPGLPDGFPEEPAENPPATSTATG